MGAHANSYLLLDTGSILFSRYVAGSLVFGVLYDKLNKLLLLAVSTFGFAVFNCLTPWCSLFPVMLVIRFIGSAFCGGLDTGKEYETSLTIPI